MFAYYRTLAVKDSQFQNTRLPFGTLRSVVAKTTFLSSSAEPSIKTSETKDQSA